MYARTEMKCRTCGRKRWVDTQEVMAYGILCQCDGIMESTGAEEYDSEFAQRANAGEFDDPDRYYRGY